MPQSLSNVIVHIVFSTKYRQKLILPEIENDLYGYLGATLNNLGCNTIIVGGHLDHVHCLCRLSRVVTQSKLLEELKKNSSKWIKAKDPKFENFYWQDGYGIFSVSQKQVSIVIDYIKNQKHHHSKSSFQDEYRQILIKNDIKFDEKFVWD